MVYGSEINLVDMNMHTKMRNTEAVVFASMGVLFQVITEKTKYTSIFMNIEQNSRQINNAETGDECVKAQICGNDIEDQKHIHQDIKNRLNSEKTDRHWVQKRLSSPLLSKNINIKIYGIVIFRPLF
jgi:hypothetical protein